jgi:hypothetical protein
MPLTALLSDRFDVFHGDNLANFYFSLSAVALHKNPSIAEWITLAHLHVWAAIRLKTQQNQHKIGVSEPPLRVYDWGA